MRARELRDADDRVLDVARGDHHEVGELVDDDQEVGVRLELALAARRQHDLVVDDGLVEVVDVAEAERREVVVAHVHLLDDPLQRFGRLLRVRDDGRDEVRDPGVDRELDALRVDEHHAHVGGLGPHQQARDHRVDEARLARPGGAGHEEVGHLREVRDDVAAADVLADADRHRVRRSCVAAAERSTSPSETISRSLFGISTPIALLPGIGERMRTSLRRDGVREVLAERGDPLDLDARARARSRTA